MANMMCSSTYMAGNVQRQNSYEEKWNKTNLTPRQLAESGFYNLRRDNRVQCYACGLKLEIRNASFVDSSEKLDVLHARLAPMCYLLVFRKGHEFIDAHFQNEVRSGSQWITCDTENYRLSTTDNVPEKQ